MAISVESFDPVPVEVFGSLVTLVDPADVPLGLSPDCADVEFFPGGVRTRPGLSSVFTAIGGNPKVNGLSNFININLTGKMLVFTSAGELYKENTPGVLTLVASGLPLTAYMKSTTLFGGEYMAFSDGKVGLEPPQQFDDTTFGRVSQVGPCEGPAVADEENPVGPNSPSTGASIAGADVDWTSPGNITASDNTRATAALTAGQSTDPLRATGFGFAIAGVSVVGIKVEWELRRDSGTGTLTIKRVRLVKGGAILGAEKAPNTALTDGDVYYSFGADGDNWGALPTLADVNDATFGAEVIVECAGASATVGADHCRITIYTGPVETNGPRNPVLGEHIAGTDIDWAGPSNVTSSNDVYATASLNDMQKTDYLRATGLGFSLGIGKVVGIKAEVEVKRQSGTGSLTVEKISLVRNGAIIGTQKTPGTAITDTEQYLSFGDSSDTWGFCPKFVETNDTTFGVQLTVVCAGGAGTVVAVDHIRVTIYTSLGQVSAGEHQVVVWYHTASGYETRVSPPVKWTAKGERRAVLTGIAVGPANVRQRRLGFSAVDSSSFFHIPKTMVIDDNTTTTLTVDFTDATLLNGRTVDRLFRRIELPQCAGVLKYAGARRLVWWGERAKMSGWRNLSFDAGFSGTRPLGWTNGTNFAGQGSKVESFGFSYQLTGDGATAIRGEIKQNALLDAWGNVALIEKNRAYKVRARVRKSSGLVSGRLNIDLVGTALDTAGLLLLHSDLTTNPQEFSAELTPAQSSLPADLALRIFADQTPTSGESFFVDEVEIFPSDEPSHGSIVRVSDAEDPEAYDGINGLLIVSENDGQAVRNAFELRDIAYLVKERSLHATADDGFNDPSGWRIEQVSEKVGTPSPQGVGIGEDWAVIAGRAGLYLFSGGAAQKISQEIQPTWNRINWAHGHKLWVKVDVEAKRILIGVPLDSATEPNRVLYLDYVQGFGEPIEGNGYGRKWALWNLAANSAEIVERSTSQARAFLGNNAANGKVYEILSTQRSDDGVAINGYYRTAFLSRSKGMGMQLFGYLSSDVSGAGTLQLAAYKLGDQTMTLTPSWKLVENSSRHMERKIRVKSEEVSFKVGTNAVGEWFSMAKIIAWAKPYPWAFMRGGRN